MLGFVTWRWLGLAFVIAACVQIEPGDEDATSAGGHTAANPHPSGGMAGAVTSGGASGTSGASGAAGAAGAAGSGGTSDGASEDVSEDASGEADALGEDSALDAPGEAKDALPEGQAFVCIGDAAAATTCWFKVYGLCFDTFEAACDCLACPIAQCKATSAKKGRLNWGSIKDQLKYGADSSDSSTTALDGSNDAAIEDAAAESDTGDASADAPVDAAADAPKDAAPSVQMNVTCAPATSGDAALD